MPNKNPTSFGQLKRNNSRYLKFGQFDCQVSLSFEEIKICKMIFVKKLLCWIHELKDFIKKDKGLEDLNHLPLCLLNAGKNGSVGSM